MVDGIKCEVRGINPDTLKSKVDFRVSVNENTGEAMPYSSAKYRDLRLTLYPDGLCRFRGSIHKYGHGGVNSTDFTCSDLRHSVDELAEFFEEKPEHFILHNLEVGVNLDYPVREITDNLLMYGTRPFVAMPSSNRDWQGLECRLTQYRIKVYGKNAFRLRVEAHASKMQHLLKTTGQSLLTLSSLRETDVLNALGQNLLKTWDKVMVRESFDPSAMNSADADFLAFGSYSGFWMDLHRANPERLRKERKRFLALQENFKTTSRHSDVCRLACEKWQHLLMS